MTAGTTPTACWPRQCQPLVQCLMSAPTTMSTAVLVPPEKAAQSFPRHATRSSRERGPTSAGARRPRPRQRVGNAAGGRIRSGRHWPNTGVVPCPSATSRIPTPPLGFRRLPCVLLQGHASHPPCWSSRSCVALDPAPALAPANTHSSHNNAHLAAPAAPTHMLRRAHGRNMCMGGDAGRHAQRIESVRFCKYSES